VRRTVTSTLLCVIRYGVPTHWRVNLACCRICQRCVNSGRRLTVVDTDGPISHPTDELNQLVGCKPRAALRLIAGRRCNFTPRNERWLQTMTDRQTETRRNWRKYRDRERKWDGRTVPSAANSCPTCLYGLYTVIRKHRTVYRWI